MNASLIQDYRHMALWPRRISWLMLLAVGLSLALVMQFLVSPVSGSGRQVLPHDSAHELIGYANLLLIGSTVLYVAHLWFTAKAVGRWASALAALGALGCIVALSAQWVDGWYFGRAGSAPVTGMADMMALFSAATVVIYLVMERVYRTRSAGAFVMPIVVGAVLFEISLDASSRVFGGGTPPVLESYWKHAHVLGNFIGYGSFAVAAAAGMMHLFRDHAEKRARDHGIAVRSLPDTLRIDRLMHQAIFLGFPVFSVAILLGMFWAREAWGRYWAWDPKETWALLVWLTYASYFGVRYVFRWSGRRVAWWAIIGFGLTVFCFLGVNLFWPGLHVYGPRP